jgi:hypothetical protein
VTSLSDSAMKQMSEWCALAPAEDGRRDCSFQAVASLYWGGENDFHASVRYCSAITDEGDAKDCFGRLAGMARYFRGRDIPYMQRFCAAYPQAYASLCASIR